MSAVAQSYTITGHVIGRWRLKVGLLLLRFAFWLMHGFRMEVEINGRRTETYRVHSRVAITAEVREPTSGWPC